jgi:hypothetical protein
MHFMARSWLLGVILVSAQGLAHGELEYGIVTRTPSHPFPSSTESAAVDGGVVSLNPNGDPVTFSSGLSSTTRVSVDPIAGQVQGYVGYTLPSNLTSFADMIGSFASGSLGASGMVMGPNFESVPVTIEFLFDGKFKFQGGPAELNFTAALSGQASTAEDDAEDRHSTSQIMFSMSPAKPGAVSTLISYKTGAIIEDTTEIVDDPLAIPTVISQTPDALAGLLRIQLLARPGETVSVVALLSGFAFPGTEPVTGNYLAGSAAVDFLHTGTVHVYVPQGYSFTGDPVFLAATAAVPEPMGWQLLLAAAGAILLVRSQRTHRCERAA